MNSSESEKFIQDLFNKKFGIKLIKIKESSDKSPDFEFINNETRVFVCELKDIQYAERTSENGWSISYYNSIKEATRIDNSVSRVAQKIYDGHKQLVSYSEPKVLIILNSEPLVDIKDLVEAYDGYHSYGNEDFGYNNVCSAKISNGRIKSVKQNIDLYIWIDVARDLNIFFRYTSQKGHEIACKYFKS